MLLESIMSYVEAAEGRGEVVLSKYNNYLQTLFIKRMLLLQTYDLTPAVETMGVRLLKFILENIDTQYLRQLPNDIDQYTRYWVYVKEDLDRMLNTNTGMIHRDTFIHKTTTVTNEYLIPVGHENPLVYLPLNKSYSEWGSINPIKLLGHDSNEYTLNIRHDNIRFKKDQPSFAVIGIDTVALGMKYWKYNKDNPEISIIEFIHREVLRPLSIDMIDIWLCNQILRLFDIEEASDIKFDNTTIADTAYNYIGQTYITAMIDIWKLIKLIKLGKDPNVFLNSVDLMTSTIGQYIQNLVSYNQIEYAQQYYWQIYIRDMRALELLLKLYGSSPEHATSKHVMRILRYRLQKLNNTKFYNNIRDHWIKTYVISHLNDLMVRYVS